MEMNNGKTRTPGGNSGFASCGVTVVNSSAVFQFNFSTGLTVLCPEIPHERKAAKRWQQAEKKGQRHNDNEIFAAKRQRRKWKPSPQKQECGCPSLQPSLRSHTHAFFAIAPHLLTILQLDK